MDQMEDRTISVPEAGRRVGLSKNAAYKAAKAFAMFRRLTKDILTIFAPGILQA